MSGLKLQVDRIRARNRGFPIRRPAVMVRAIRALGHEHHTDGDSDMKRRMDGLMGCLLLGALLAGPATADELDDVAGKIIAAAEKIKSLSADMTMKTEMVNSGMSMVSDAQGHMEFARQGGKELMRMDMEMSTVTKMGDQEQKMEAKSVMINDGEFTYTVSDQMGQKVAMKMANEKNQVQFSGKQMFDDLRKDNTLALLPEDKVDSVAAYVIEATPKQAGQSGKSRYYFAKDSGMVVKMIMHTPDGEPMTTMTYSNIKLNADIKPDRFKFVAPEGVQLMDMTGGGTP